MTMALREKETDNNKELHCGSQLHLEREKEKKQNKSYNIK
jgi:hypothetical protein